MKHTVVLFSGGMDSTVLLYSLASDGRRVSALSVFYGQRHKLELQAAQRIAVEAGHRFDHRIGWTEFHCPAFAAIAGGSSQTREHISVPEGHYADPSMRITVVPNRNMVLLSLATAYAVSLGAESVAYAAHAGDHAVYPDCRPAFADSMAAAMRLCHYEPVELERPFVTMSKADIVTLGSALDVPFALTYSCYKGAGSHCGLCGTCVERKEAFTLSGVQDPTEYR